VVSVPEGSTTGTALAEKAVAAMLSSGNTLRELHPRKLADCAM
jgi:hypothetical protein